jgi:hypothetical protein
MYIYIVVVDFFLQGNTNERKQICGSKQAINK